MHGYMKHGTCVASGILEIYFRGFERIFEEKV